MAKPEGPREWSPRKSQIEQFILDQKIRMDWEPVPSNPNMDAGEWSDEAFHYRVSFKKGSQSLVTFYSMGAALTDPPTPEEVLRTLADDAAGYENNPEFEGWANEYGYDTDSRKAERTFKTIERAAEKLKKFLGEPAYKQLLFETEQE